MSSNSCRRCGAPLDFLGGCSVCKRQDAILREQELQTAEQRKQTELLQQQARAAEDAAEDARREQINAEAHAALQAEAERAAAVAKAADDLAREVIRAGERVAAAVDAAEGVQAKMKALAQFGEGMELVSLEVWSRCYARLPYQFGEAYGRLRQSVAKAVVEVWTAREQFPPAAHAILKKLAESFLFPQLDKAAEIAKRAADSQRAVVSIVRAAEVQDARAAKLRELRSAVVTRALLAHHRRELVDIGAPVDSSDERLRSGLGRAFLSVVLFVLLLGGAVAALDAIEPHVAFVLSQLEAGGRLGARAAVVLGLPLVVVVWLNVWLNRFFLRRSQLRVIDYRIWEATDKAEKIRAPLKQAEAGLEALAKKLRACADPKLWEIANPAWFGELTMPREMQRVP